jgi:hypothetical protein
MRIEKDGDYQKITINVAVDIPTFDAIIQHYLIVEKKIKCEMETDYVMYDDEELYLTKVGKQKIKEMDCRYYLIEGNYYVDYYDVFTFLIDTLSDIFENSEDVEEYIVMKNTRDDIIIKFIGEVPNIIASFMIVDKLTRCDKNGTI